MRRAVFKATIVGRKAVARTGCIRIPTSFRIRVYEDGEVVITTRGQLENVEGFDLKNCAPEARQKLLDGLCARLGELGKSRTGSGS